MEQTAESGTEPEGEGVDKVEKYEEEECPEQRVRFDVHFQRQEGKRQKTADDQREQKPPGSRGDVGVAVFLVCGFRAKVERLCLRLCRTFFQGGGLADAELDDDRHERREKKREQKDGGGHRKPKKRAFQLQREEGRGEGVPKIGERAELFKNDAFLRRGELQKRAEDQKEGEKNEKETCERTRDLADQTGLLDGTFCAPKRVFCVGKLLAGDGFGKTCHGKTPFGKI